MRIFLATAATLVASPAFAQTIPPLLEVEDERIIVDAFGMSVDDLEDTDIINSAGDMIGEVDEVLMTTNGTVVAVFAEVGGFLGLGDKEVVIELDLLRRQDGRLVTDLALEQLKAIPVCDD